MPMTVRKMYMCVYPELALLTPVSQRSAAVCRFAGAMRPCRATPLGALVCTQEAFSGLSPEERGRAFELLQSATRDGGVHLVGTIVRGKRGVSVAELRRQYKGWTISVEDDSGTSKSFLAKKIAS